MDQNEKMVMYGVTHVMAVDGYSRKIVGMVTMPVKNAITIYHTLLRPLLLRLQDSVCLLIFIRRIATNFLSRGKS